MRRPRREIEASGGSARLVRESERALLVFLWQFYVGPEGPTP